MDSTDSSQIRLVRVKGYANLVMQQYLDGQWRNIPVVELSDEEIDVPKGIPRKPRKKKAAAKPKPKNKPMFKPSRVPAGGSDTPLGRRRPR